MKKCRICDRTDVTFSVYPLTNGRKFYAECDTCRAVRATETKTCSLCDKTLPLKDFYVKGGSSDGRLQACCKVCYNKRKRTHAALKKGIAVPLKEGAIKNNPFMWRTYEQPVPMKLGKWDHQARLSYAHQSNL